MVERYHLIIDANDCSGSFLQDNSLLNEVIGRISELCKMKILHGPVVINGMSYNPGLTGFAIIDFSHISIHTFTDSRQVSVDIFSSKGFDCDAVVDYVVEAFKLNKSNI